MNQHHFIYKAVLVLLLSRDNNVVKGFMTPFSSRNGKRLQGNKLATRRHMAAPQRLSDNADGPLYVNDKCINCSACSMFAPEVFGRSDQRAKHIVQNQPSTEEELDTARAALRACPVAAIRLENQAYRSHRSMEALTKQEEDIVSSLSNQSAESFPRPVSPNIPGVYFVGHHNSKSFGAAPYLLQTKQHGTVLMDSPKFSKKAVEVVETITGPDGPSYMVLSHVDDSADHGKWHAHYPNMKRIFHSGDLGKHNWIGDKTLEEVELLQTLVSNNDNGSSSSLQAMTLEGRPVSPEDYVNHELLLLHTPGHSPGSITLWRRPTEDGKHDGIIFTGDTYSYTTRNGGHMSGFPRYGNNHQRQAKSLEGLLDLDWHLVAPGHGHPRDYTRTCTVGDDDDETIFKTLRRQEMQPAFAELS